MPSLEDWRDIIIIAAGSLMLLFFLAALVFTVVIGLATRMLIGTVQSLVKEDVSPLVSSAQGTVKRVQGTAAFVGEKAVGPIIRVYSVAAGARRFVAVVSGVSRRFGGDKQG